MRRNSALLSGSLALSLLLLLGRAADASPILIDNFASSTNLGPNPVVGMFVNQTFPGPTTVVDPSLNAIGGVRTVTLGTFSGVIPDFASVTIGGNRLSYSSTIGGDASVRLLYDANGAGLGLNLTGYNTLFFDLLNYNFAFGNDMPVTVSLTDSLLNTNSFTLPVSTAGNPTLSFPLSNFPGVNLGDIRSISVSFDPQISQDFDIGRIQALDAADVMPEPGSFLVMGAVLLGGGIWTLRRRRTA